MFRQRAARVRRRGESPSDPYLTQRPPKQTSRCPRCSAVYRNKRWHQAPSAVLPSHRTREEPPSALCPACRKTQDHYFGGIVTVHWPKAQSEREEMLHLIKHEEAKGRQINALERIIALDASADRLTVTTTNERLAQRIGRALQRAFHGKTISHWSHDNQLIRVKWMRAPYEEDRTMKRRRP
jgi:NMD protein affecting ribosome stability and mRNA decay